MKRFIAVIVAAFVAVTLGGALASPASAESDVANVRFSYTQPGCGPDYEHDTFMPTNPMFILRIANNNDTSLTVELSYGNSSKELHKTIVSSPHDEYWLRLNLSSFPVGSTFFVKYPPTGFTYTGVVPDCSYNPAHVRATIHTPRCVRGVLKGTVDVLSLNHGGIEEFIDIKQDGKAIDPARFPNRSALDAFWSQPYSIKPFPHTGIHTLRLYNRGVLVAKLSYRLSSGCKVQSLHRPVVVTSPQIRGKVKVGKTVRAYPGKWRPAVSSYGYHWYVNGRSIGKATKKTFKVRSSLRGKRLAVRVSAKVKGYPTARTTSRYVRVH